MHHSWVPIFPGHTIYVNVVDVVLTWEPTRGVMGNPGGTQTLRYGPVVNF